MANCLHGMNPAWCSMCKGLSPLTKQRVTTVKNPHDISERLIERLRSVGAKAYITAHDKGGNTYTVCFKLCHLATLLPLLSGTPPSLCGDGTRYQFYSKECVLRLLRAEWGVDEQA